MARVFERLEIVETGRRRRWTEDEKLRIVAESLSGSRQVSSTARRHGISRSLLTTRRRQFRVQPQPGGEAVSGFVPAVVLPEGPASAPAVSSSTRMEIVVSGDRRNHRRCRCRGVMIDHHQVRLEGSPAVLAKLASRGPSSSSSEVLSFVQEWRAGVDKRENWIVTLKRGRGRAD